MSKEAPTTPKKKEDQYTGAIANLKGLANSLGNKQSLTTEDVNTFKSAEKVCTATEDETRKNTLEQSLGNVERLNQTLKKEMTEAIDALKDIVGATDDDAKTFGPKYSQEEYRVYSSLIKGDKNIKRDITDKHIEDIDKKISAKYKWQKKNGALKGTVTPKTRAEKKTAEEMKITLSRAGMLNPITETSIAPVATFMYYENKKLANLTDYNEQNKLMMIELDSVRKMGEDAWILGYKLAQLEGAPDDVCRNVAHKYMHMKTERELEIINLQYPYLRI